MKKLALSLVVATALLTVSCGKKCKEKCEKEHCDHKGDKKCCEKDSLAQDSLAPKKDSIKK